MNDLIILRCKDGTLVPYAQDFDKITESDIESAQVYDIDGNYEDLECCLKMTLGEISGKLGQLKKEKVMETEEIYVCPECGNEVNDDMMHCPVCDTPLEWNDVPEINAVSMEPTVNAAEIATDIVLTSINDNIKRRKKEREGNTRRVV